jgi:hypothetical protein
MTKLSLYALAAMAVVTLLPAAHGQAADSAPTPKALTESSVAGGSGLWTIYDQSLKNAKYVDLTHTLSPSIPVWKGFGPSKFGPTLSPQTGLSLPKFL